MAPTVRASAAMGTQMKVASSRPVFFRMPVRLRKRGSRLTWGTTTGFPLWTTRPVMPSHTL